jgi:molybdopterin synthase sulfur carrier subunit
MPNGECLLLILWDVPNGTFKKEEREGTPMIRVKFFGYFRQLAGQKEVALEIDAMDIASLLQLLKEKYGDEFYRIVVSEGRIRDDVLLLVNQKSAKENDVVRSGDEVAILPPVTGG